MAFAKISADLTVKSSIELDNIFVLEYLPFAPEGYSKIYIYGKLVATGQSDADADRICSLFAITEDELVGAFKYWEEKGLVRVISTAPLAVEYLPIKYIRPSGKTFSKTKYSDFNKQLAGIFPNRAFLPSELNEYYSCMEENRIEPDGMLAVMSYCAKIKTKKIGWQYIVKVAANMAAEGCHTTDDFVNKIDTYELLSVNMRELFRILGIKRPADYDDVKLYKKWTEEYGFDTGTVFSTAKNVYGEMKGLDTVLSRYRSDGLITLADIEKYNAQKDRLLSLTKELLKKLDVRYTRLDYYADYYVKEWLKMGFSGEALKTVADHCFRNERKSCEKMSAELKLLHDAGITDDETIREKYLGESKVDSAIKRLFDILKISGDVSSRDRDNYNIWVNIWGLPLDMIEKAAADAVGDAYPKNRMAAIIRGWYEKGYRTLSDIKTSTKKAVKEKSEGIIQHGDDMSELNKKIFEISPEEL